MSDLSFASQPARTFGPVPSRRFGQSLGLNTIPPKTCTYSCVYCQVGVTSKLTLQREQHTDPGELAADVKSVLGKLAETGQHVDYLTFVPDGEPTLDSRLSDQIEMVKPLGVPIAIITNSSLLTQTEVRDAVAKADRVSIKVDAVRYDTWRAIDRPHGDLRLEEILDGVIQFSREYKGELDTETMLVRGINDSLDDAKPLTAFLEWVRPHRSYLSIPTRPPAVSDVQRPDEEALIRVFETVSPSVEQVEMLTGFEGSEFGTTGNLEDDILAITSVHPMRADQVERLLEEAGSNMDLIEWMVRQEKLRAIIYGGQRFFIRRFTRH
jgi:wyosine [tRNA(Phe)-imidazoG37] synthetase (radical SAM superfamily)